MKRKLLTLISCVGLLAMVSCDGGIGGTLTSNIDLNVLENEAETRKIYDEIVKHLGDQITKVDEVKFYISNPDEKSIKREGDKVEMSLTLDVLSPSDPKKIKRMNYWSSSNGWQAPQTMEVSLSGAASAKQKENFNLESTMWNFKEKVSFETLTKIIKESIAKNNKDPKKYTYRYIHSIDITSKGYSVSIHAKLASNDQKVNEYYKFGFDGKFRR